MLLLCVLLISFAIRLQHIGAHSLWYDETVSVYLASLPLPELLAHTARDIHPPAYYILLWLWRHLTTPIPWEGLEILYAFPSVLFGVLTVAILYPIGRRLSLSAAAVGITLLLSAFHPFQVWYSQEVRMYTAAAFLGLLSIWLSLQWLHYSSLSSLAAVKLWRIGALYALAGALNLYILYYSGIVLAGITIFIFWSNVVSYPWKKGMRTTVHWILVNLVLIALWSPWIPTFLRQITNPPVPPWRQPWHSLDSLLAALRETVAALIVGQTMASEQWLVFLALGLVVLMSAIYSYTKSVQVPAMVARLTLCCLLFPLLGLFTVSSLGTPIFHVRYVFIYSPIALIFLSALLLLTANINQWFAGLLLFSLLTLQFAGLLDYWRNPALQPDDHRGAVQMLANSWRPGDAILLNAGWLYPAITTYWPREPASRAAVPPPITARLRLSELTKDAVSIDALTQIPTLLLTGSVGGDSSLGWGLEESDFFATSPQIVTESLDHLNTGARRIWHYRMYDTVSDQNGVIRTWLSENTDSIFSLPITGRDFGRIELLGTPFKDVYTADSDVGPIAQFGDRLALLDYHTYGAATRGRFYYLELWWQVLPESVASEAELSMSLRLLDENGLTVVQRDETPYVPTPVWSDGNPTRAVLALPVPHDLPAGAYSVGLIVYRRDSLEPLTVNSTAGKTTGTLLRLVDFTLGTPLP